MTNKNKDKLGYGVLYVGMVFGVLAIYSSRSDAGSQATVLMLMIAFYLTWGLVFHHLRGDATKKLLFEYLLISAISLLAALFVFFF